MNEVSRKTRECTFLSTITAAKYYDVLLPLSSLRRTPSQAMRVTSRRANRIKRVLLGLNRGSYTAN